MLLSKSHLENLIPAIYQSPLHLSPPAVTAHPGCRVSHNGTLCIWPQLTQNVNRMPFFFCIQQKFKSSVAKAQTKSVTFNSSLVSPNQSQVKHLTQRQVVAISCFISYCTGKTIAPKWCFGGFQKNKTKKTLTLPKFLKWLNPLTVVVVTNYPLVGIDLR